MIKRLRACHKGNKVGAIIDVTSRLIGGGLSDRLSVSLTNKQTHTKSLFLCERQCFYPRMSIFRIYIVIYLSELRCGTMPEVWGAHWNWNSLMMICESSLPTITYSVSLAVWCGTRPKVWGAQMKIQLVNPPKIVDYVMYFSCFCHVFNPCLLILFLGYSQQIFFDASTNDSGLHSPPNIWYLAPIKCTNGIMYRKWLKH